MADAMPNDPDDEALLRFLLNGKRPKLRKQGRPRKREPLRGTAALFADYFQTYGGGYGPYDRNVSDDLARDWAYKWAMAMKTDHDAEEFLKLGGRPTELKILVEWDAAGLPRQALAARVRHRNEGFGTVLEEMRSGRLTVGLAAQILGRSQAG